MNGAVLANRRTQPAESDFYPTPTDVTRAILGFIPVNRIIWEPACGDGSMSKVLSTAGHLVISSDLHDRGFGIPERDFLHGEIKESYDWIVTNPPYRIADAFVRRALDLGKPTAFLLKSQFWHAEKRRALFERHPPRYVLPLTWRPDFAGGGSPTMDVLWTIWNASPAEATFYRPLPRPRYDPDFDT